MFTQRLTASHLETDGSTMGVFDSLKSKFAKPYKSIGIDEAKELIASGATLVDVRDASEWRTGHAAAAKHVPLDRLRTSTAGIPQAKPVVAICASGMRSQTAAGILAAKGYDAYTVRGGMSAWRRAGEPTR
ncbi:rhodanese-related sulfurtransferase [Subtercola frigoramans]|uniref:Rhodanese-related sulfurtransferase n=2 Tax=Subtercola frigoramans TaxID=120298 RepID=A0ABS2L148_9MICO|nr:rhodanese-related sulfurtransferase [Subtercola frigoramans]